jgi:hypothetical protein
MQGETNPVEGTLRRGMRQIYRSGLSHSTAAEGWSQDVSEDIAHEVLDRAYDAVSAPMPKLPGCIRCHLRVAT